MIELPSKSSKEMGSFANNLNAITAIPLSNIYKLVMVEVNYI